MGGAHPTSWPTLGGTVGPSAPLTHRVRESSAPKCLAAAPQRTKPSGRARSLCCAAQLQHPIGWRSGWRAPTVSNGGGDGHRAAAPVRAAGFGLDTGCRARCGRRHGDDPAHVEGDRSSSRPMSLVPPRRVIRRSSRSRIRPLDGGTSRSRGNRGRTGSDPRPHHLISVPRRGNGEGVRRALAEASGRQFVNDRVGAGTKSTAPRPRRALATAAATPLKSLLYASAGSASSPTRAGAACSALRRTRDQEHALQGPDREEYRSSSRCEERVHLDDATGGHGDRGDAIMHRKVERYQQAGARHLGSCSRPRAARGGAASSSCSRPR